jgi:predicted nucleic acid-binding protein
VTVVDASVWTSRFVTRDVHHTASRSWLSNYLEGGQPLFAPYILLSEVSGAAFRRTGSAQVAQQAIRILLQVRQLHLLPVDSAVGLGAALLAANNGLGGADAVYVEIARRLGVPLVTWDRNQLSRATPFVAARSP